MWSRVATHPASHVRLEPGRWPAYAGNLTMSNTDYQTGVILDSGGSLILGQDQDSVGGNFDSSQTHRGNLDELAVFDQVLDEATIVAHRDAILCP